MWSNNPFERLEHAGIRFFANGEPYVLRGGMYGNGRGAVFVETPAGEAVDKLTVNLDEEPLEPHRLHVKVSESSVAGDSIRAQLLRIGVFVREKAGVGAGYVKNYAEEWSFAGCGQPGHTRVRDYPRGLAIDCPDCLERWTAEYKERVEQRLAKDTVSRLRGRKEFG